MAWEQPTFVEIKMDSEVSSYQEDREENPVDRAEVELGVRTAPAAA